MIAKEYRHAIELWWSTLDDKQKLKAMLSLLSEASEFEIVNVYSVEDAKEMAGSAIDFCDEDVLEFAEAIKYMAPTWYHTGEPIHE